MMTRRHFGHLAGAATLGASLPLSSAQAAQGFHVPGEEERHEATFMQWPNSRRVYDDSYFLAQTQQTIADVANAISDFEPVVMLADRSHHADIRRLVSADVELWDVPTEDLWCRDSGAIMAKNSSGQRAVVGIQFNGWGRKQVHRNDARVAGIVAEALDLPYLDTGLKGEGGSTEQDGHGLLIAHESSWINANRNRGRSKAAITQALQEAYGADQIIWSPGVKGQDITDYHIDSLARFTGPGRVLANVPLYPDTSDPFHAAALETVATLKAAGLQVTTIYEPEQRRVQSWDFVASYANYYVCNGAVIAAEFGDRDMDAEAVRALRRAYPGRQVVTLNVDALGELGGGVHCATQQLIA